MQNGPKKNNTASGKNVDYKQTVSAQGKNRSDVQKESANGKPGESKKNTVKGKEPARPLKNSRRSAVRLAKPIDDCKKQKLPQISNDLNSANGSESKVVAIIKMVSAQD